MTSCIFLGDTIPTECPKCGSSHISADAPELDGDDGYEIVTCRACGAVWKETWKCVSWEYVAD